MHSKTVILAAAAALVSNVAAQQARPRIYFPRHVKRQFINATITSNEPVPVESTTTTSTRRQTSLDDILSSIRDGIIGKPSDTETPDDGSVTTIVISSTIVVPPPTDPPTSDTAASTGGIPSSIVLPTDSSSSPETETIQSSSSSDPSTSSEIVIAPTGIVRPTSNFLTELLPTELFPSPTSSTTSDAVTSTTEPATEPATVSETVSETAAPVETSTSVEPVPEPEPTSTSTALLDPIISVITSILPPVPTITPDPFNSTSSEPPSTPEPTETSFTEPPPPPTSTEPPPVPTSTVVTDEPPPPTSTVTEPPVTTDPPVITNSTSADPPPPPTVTISSNSTLFPDPTTTGTGDGSGDATTTGSATTTPAPTVTDTEPPWLPTTILVEPSSSISTPTEVYAPTTTAALPSDLPEVIRPADPSGIVQPEDTTEIRIGFLKGENYKFVVENPMAAAQIFSLLPRALADAHTIPIDRIKMKRLEPLNTQDQLGYITTLAKLYYPTNMIEALRIDIKLANSPLYNNKDELVFNLTKNINPAIDIITGLDEDATGRPGSGPGGNIPGDSSGDPFTQPQNQQTPMQQGTAAAIGVGAVSIAAAYGAAMFFIARRYKRKKLAHRRASSTANSSEMRYTGTGSPALMGGALLSRDFSTYGVAGGRHSHGSGQSGRSGAGNSGRTAYISAPVAAENSLGWN